jgi:hypothetical protein
MLPGGGVPASRGCTPRPARGGWNPRYIAGGGDRAPGRTSGVIRAASSQARFGMRGAVRDGAALPARRDRGSEWSCLAGTPGLRFGMRPLHYCRGSEWARGVHPSPGFSARGEGSDGGTGRGVLPSPRPSLEGRGGARRWRSGIGVQTGCPLRSLRAPHFGLEALAAPPVVTVHPQWVSADWESVFRGCGSDRMSAS